jgi:hypothetical protein
MLHAAQLTFSALTLMGLSKVMVSAEIMEGTLG